MKQFRERNRRTGNNKTAKKFSPEKEEKTTVRRNKRSAVKIQREIGKLEVLTEIAGFPCFWARVEDSYER